MPTLVQAVSFAVTNTTSPIPVTLSSTKAGNCLVVHFSSSFSGTSNATISGITLGGSADHFARQILAGNPTVDSIILDHWADPNCAGGQTAISISWTGSGTGSIIGLVEEWSGLMPVTAVADRTASQTATGISSFSSSAVATTRTKDQVAIGSVAAFNATAIGTITGPGAPWVNQTQVTSISTHIGLLAGYDILTATGTPAYAGTFGVTADYASSVVTYIAVPTAQVPSSIIRGKQGATARSKLSGPRSVLPTVAAATPAKFVQPASTVRGQRQKAKSRNASSLGIPAAFVQPATPSKFSLPRLVARGRAKAAKSKLASSLGLPRGTPTIQVAAPFTPPKTVIRGQRQKAKSRFNSGTALPAVAPPPVVSSSGLVAAPINDDFLLSTLNPQWSPSGTVTPGGSPPKLLLACTPSYSSVTSVSKYDWTNTYALAKVTPYTGATSAQSFISLSQSFNVNQIDFGYSAGNLVVQTWLGGVNGVPFGTTYNAVNHAWLRMRLDLTFVYFDVSPDGQTWTNLFQWNYVSHGLAVWRMNVILGSGHFSAGTDGTSTFQFFNCNASIAGPVTVANVTSGGVTTPNISVPNVGPQAVDPNNVEGNTLLVLAVWNTQATLGGPLLPTGSVADDQGNWWRFVGDSGQKAVGIRVGAWLCSNALAVRNWLSFCPQGYAGSFVFQVVELNGMPASYCPGLDFHVSVGSSNVAITNPAISGTAGEASYVFVALGNQFTSATVSSVTGSALASIGATHSGGSDPSQDATCRLDTWWGAFAANTPVSAAWTTSGIGASAALMIGITVNSKLPAQSRPTFPRVMVDAGFGALPGDPSLSILDDQWQDLSPWTIGKRGEIAITAQRGQQYELSTPEAGQLTVGCDNLSGDFNPQWAGSQLYSDADNFDMSMQLTGTQNWQIFTGGPGTTLAPSSSFAFASATGCYANNSLKLVPASGATTTVVYEYTTDGSTPLVPNPNYQYTESVWVYSPAGWSGGVKLSMVAVNGVSGVIVASTTVASIPAATWTQITVTGLPGLVEDGTSLWAYLDFNGSPTSANPFYLAEISVKPGSTPAQTGLVRIGVPVRASAFWNGRRYPVGFGYVERWPQEWPDMPQWGWSRLVATDVVGVANSVNLPSAVQGEILADNPYFCFPFNEQYTSTSAGGSNAGGKPSTATLTGVDGMFAVNTSPTNARPAIYTDGTITPVVTGQTMGLLGDPGTGMGNQADSAISAAVAGGPGAIYGPDLNMPFNQYVVQFWASPGTLSTPSPSNQFVKLFDLVCQQDPTFPGAGSGVLLSLGYYYQAGATFAQVWVATNVAPTLTPFITVVSNTTDINGSVFSIPANLITVTIEASTYAISINGLTFRVAAYSNPLSSPIAVVFGQATYTTGVTFQTANYAISYGTMFPARIPEWRTWSHARAGLDGFANDGVTDRALRYITWASLNLGLSGTRDAASALGPAYSTAGSSLASALNSDCSSFGGKWIGNANGNLVILSREAQYNQSTPTVFGDSPSGVLNQNSGFNRGLAHWVASGCAANITSPGFSGNSAAILTFSGSTNPTFINDAIPVTPGTWYEQTLWVKSPEGWNGGVSATVSWYSGAALISTSAVDAYPETSVWSPAILTAQAPLTADSAKFGIQVNGTPPAGPSVWIDQSPVRLAFDNVPYLPAQGFDFDNTYINNDIQAQMTEGPITTSAPAVQDQASIKKYFRRGPQQIGMSGTTAGSAYDLANWRINQYKDPSMRVRAIESQPHAVPASFTRILQTDIADPVSMRRDPLNLTQYNLPVITQRVEHAIGPGTWTVQYQLSPYTAPGSALQVDAPGFDVIANNNLAW